MFALLHGRFNHRMPLSTLSRFGLPLKQYSFIPCLQRYVLPLSREWMVYRLAAFRSCYVPHVGFPFGLER